MADNHPTVPAPALMEDEEIRGPRRIVHREQEFQKVAVAFIKRAVVGPMFVAATVNENEMTENARARAKLRGMVSGLPDLYVVQLPAKSCWLELKWGKNGLSENQKSVAHALDACKVPRGTAWSIAHVRYYLDFAGIELAHNIDSLTVEYQARAEAAVRTAELKAETPHKPGKSRPRSRPTAGQRKFGWARERLLVG